MTSRPEPAGSLALSGRVYLGTVISSGLLAVAVSLLRLHAEPLGYQWYMLAALTFVSGSATVTLPSVPASISVSETFVFAAVLLFGPAAGTVLVALDGLVISFWMAKRRPEWYRALFNMAAPALSIWCAAHLLFYTARIEPLIRQAATINVLLVPLILFSLVYFGLNSWMIAIAVGLEMKIPPYRIWRENFLWLSLNYFSGASVALLLVVYTRDVDLRFIGVIVPLLFVLYFTYKNAMDRVEDANRHVMELSRLHLSTIETLAMAIDAKDQITHGHIRRVQALAVGLARKVGVVDERLIKAIEAAALLHDMGKLAVPEYILNKPGKLTPAEFEKMKLHAAVGADILSAIDFPYPVVPIVRHHHENWNGTGYPDRLRGTDIPIGARILSVVDCFDALTSDRPYRPRLTDDEAIEILVSRRGTMYDPLIVDKFISVHNQITPNTTPANIAPQTLTDINNAAHAPVVDRVTTATEENVDNAAEMLTLYELAQTLAGGQAGISDIADVIAKHVRRIIPSALCVFFVYDAASDEIELRHATGDSASSVQGLKIPLGHRLSGWVAANRQTIVNSDPILDLGDAARVPVGLRSCLSTPLLVDDELVGVLALYSSASDAFTEEHRRTIEVIARKISYTMKRAAEFDESGRRDPVTGLPNHRQLEQLAAFSREAGASGHSMTLMLIGIIGLKRVSQEFGTEAADDARRYVVKWTRAHLRAADILFRYGPDEVIALLDATDYDFANRLGQRIRLTLRDRPLVIQGNRVNIDVGIACVSAPGDGHSLRDLIRAIGVQSNSPHSRVDSAIVH
jgi:diguanylate cyclase (GGDEF)-like protein/putative nucleotidyltransferase with HDIG domain